MMIRSLTRRTRTTRSTRARFVTWLLLLTLVAPSCSRENTSDQSTRERVAPSDSETFPEPLPSASTPQAEIASVDLRRIESYRFSEFSFSRSFTAGVEQIFGGLDNVRIRTWRVATIAGDPLPVRVLTVSYDLPTGVPFSALQKRLWENSWRPRRGTAQKLWAVTVST